MRIPPCQRRFTSCCDSGFLLELEVHCFFGQPQGRAVGSKLRAGGSKLRAGTGQGKPGDAWVTEDKVQELGIEALTSDVMQR